METRDIQDILPLVEGPSRYLGGEINAVRKNPADVRLHMALAFPDLYEIGTSHFGLQILYDIVNRRDDLLAERVFAPDPDMEARLRESGTPLATLESGTPLAKLDIIGVSLLYELCYTNILTILDVAGIPFRA
ncbi:MAG: B12-binding domain-containing radical SAM protein, partial [Desulfococcaceae bacterium]